MARILTNSGPSKVVLPDQRKDGVIRPAVQINPYKQVTISDEQYRNLALPVPSVVRVQQVADTLVDTQLDVGATAPVKGSAIAAPDSVAVVAPDNAVTAVAASEATAVADSGPASVAYTQAEVQAVMDLANDLKAKYNAAVSLINELKGLVDTNVALTNELKAKLDLNGVLSTETKTVVNTMNA